MEERLARIRSVELLAPQLRRIDLTMVEPPELHFRAGQFVSVRLGEDFHPRRSYSIASPPSRTDGFELLAKSAGGAGDRFLDGLREGAHIRFLGPMGYFLCAPRHPGDVVMAATGVGISALLSMIDDLLSAPAEAQPPRLVLLWGLRSERDIALCDRLDELVRRGGGRFRYDIYLSEPAADWAGPRGHISGDAIATAGELDAPTYYLCGNGAMVRDVTEGLLHRGIPAGRIRTEVFYPAVILA